MTPGPSQRPRASAVCEPGIGSRKESGAGSFASETISTGVSSSPRATDGAEAAERAAETAPDVVLLDMMMPGCSGGAAIRLVHERAPDARVLAISASERIDMMHGGLRGRGVRLRDEVRPARASFVRR